MTFSHSNLSFSTTLHLREKREWARLAPAGVDYSLFKVFGVADTQAIAEPTHMVSLLKLVRPGWIGLTPRILLICV